MSYKKTRKKLESSVIEVDRGEKMLLTHPVRFDPSSRCYEDEKTRPVSIQLKTVRKVENFPRKKSTHFM